MAEFYVIDVETTGLDNTKDKVVEVAAAWRDDESSLQSASSYVSLPEGVTIPPEAKGLHHIVERDLIGAPNLGDAISGLGLPASAGHIVAHNAPFDKGFVPMLGHLKWVDTLRIAMHLYPDSPNHKNMTLYYYLGLEIVMPAGLAPHRALYDVLVTQSIFSKMLESHTIEDLFLLQAKPVLKKTCGFGKHRGSLWQDVPKDYLRWMLNQDMDADTKFTARHWINA